MKKPRHKWQPLVRSYTGRRNPKVVEVTAQQLNITEEEAAQKLEEYEAQCEVWVNDTYQVQVRRDKEEGTAVLNIRRRDGGPIMRDWRHFQQIKNELVGPECEGVELYPAESRLTDTCNKFHIYCSTDPTFRFPFGMQERDVTYDTTHNDVPGMRQRPL